MKAPEVSQRQIWRNNQTLKHDTTQCRRFVTDWGAENEQFFAGVCALSTDLGETALRARMAHKMVDALKNRTCWRTPKTKQCKSMWK